MQYELEPAQGIVLYYMDNNSHTKSNNKWEVARRNNADVFLKTGKTQHQLVC